MNGRALILMYHILDTPRSDREAKYCCLPERFAEQMAWIRRTCHPVSLDELLACLDTTTGLPDRTVAVTFDDGFSSVFEHALPVLIRYCIPSTLFVVANRVGGHNDWMSQRGMPKRSLINETQIRDMHAADVTIGSHTLSHPRLPECTPEELALEIKDSKTRLEDMISHPVQHFAYPYGLYDDTARSMVQQAGYISACSTRSGFNSNITDRFELRRIEVFGSDHLWHLKQKLKFGINEASWSIPPKYYLRRALSHLSRNK